MTLRPPAMIDVIRDFPFPVAGMYCGEDGIPRGERYLHGQAGELDTGSASPPLNELCCCSMERRATVELSDYEYTDAWLSCRTMCYSCTALALIHV